MQTKSSKERNVATTNASQLNKAYRQSMNSDTTAQKKADDSLSAKTAARFQAVADNSPQMIAQREQMTRAGITGKAVSQLVDKEEEKIPQAKFKTSPTQLKSNDQNNTGLPGNLKQGVEALSGQSLNDVKVHYNSSKPSQLNAHAYAQGTDIHIAPGQSQHLPHETWHVAQQKQGRVKPTMSVNGVAVNDDASLEKEADTMGAKAMQMKPDEKRLEE